MSTWLTRPALLSITLPESSSFDDPRKLGLEFDSIWKSKVASSNPELITVVPAAADAPYDISLICQNTRVVLEYVDVKLSGSAHIYISHREYLFGKKHALKYSIYTISENIASIHSIISFEDARENGFISRFQAGRPAFCEATGKQEPPHSISLEHALKINLLQGCEVP